MNEIVLDSAYQELNNVDEDAEKEAAAATPGETNQVWEKTKTSPTRSIWSW